MACRVGPVVQQPPVEGVGRRMGGSEAGQQARADSCDSRLLSRSGSFLSHRTQWIGLGGL